MRKILAALAALALAGGLATSPATAKPPAPKADAMLKGVPAVNGKAPASLSGSKARLAAGVAYYHHVGINQTLGNGTPTGGATGVAVLTSQHNPQVQNEPGVAEHSLWELSAQSADGQQLIEIGIRKGDASTAVPRLFVFSWKNGNPMGYANIGTGQNPDWIDNPSQAVDAQTALAYTAAGAAPSVYYQYRIDRHTGRPSWCTAAPCTTAWPTGTNGWEVAQTNQGQTRRIIGGFNDAAWSGNFTSIGVFQAFGETVSGDVSAGAADPNTCSDMASGVYGTSTSPSAALDQLAYSIQGPPLDPTTGVAETNVPDNVFVSPAASSPNAYRVYQLPLDLDRIKLGGPGFAGPSNDYVSTLAGSVGSC